MKKKLFYSLAAFFIFISCGSATNSGQITVAVPVEAVSLVPYQSNDTHTHRIMNQMFERLFDMDKDGNIIPVLATDWRYVTPTELEIDIRPDVRFHNGSILTAEDVAYSINTVISSPAFQTLFGPIKSATAINDLKVKIILKDPTAFALALLTHAGMIIVNKKVVESQNANSEHVGTGPFMFSHWNRGQNIIFHKFNDYWGTPANVQTLKFLLVADSSARSIAIETGEVDIAYDIDGSDRERLKQNQQLTFLEMALPRIEYLGINVGKSRNPMWKNEKIRNAVASSLDYQGIINAILFGAGDIASSVIQNSVVGYYDGLPQRERDVALAKKLLKEANISENVKITLWTTEGLRQKIAEVIQANLYELGFNVTVDIYEWGKYLEAIKNGDSELFLLGWTSVPADADLGIYPLLHSSSFGPKGNFTFYSNSIVDNTLDVARQELNPQKRKRLYQTIQEQIYKDVPLIPLYYPYQNVVVQNNIEGFMLNQFSIHKLASVGKK
ncbi:peptide/nickel transport system substrate-binding protein [Brevinema andersonii]|uniref:Peptide/nickel transport system substrate-binding protein n=1 Tax=Brevinema andersonii TaxID=34097 RepID=A0A1I1E5G8_BREAD|nr:ABC transporter substrate-binding protein [Brevinema andersonii]SFB82354.1 peptide/nickel transport system substrate-binding protein [Brevinema andersonii]